MAWVLFVVAAIVAVVFFVGQSDKAKRLAEAETKLKELEAALEAAKKQPIAVAAGGRPGKKGSPPPPAPVPVAVPTPTPANDAALANLAKVETNLAKAETKLQESLAEVKRLETAIQETERRIQAEKEKSETAIAAAVAKASAAEAAAVSARSRAAEANHNAASEADTFKATLAAAEQKAQELADAVKRAEAEASLSAQRSQKLETETDALRAKLAQAETNLRAAGDTTAAIEKAKKEATALAEARLRETYEASMKEARAEWDRDLQQRLNGERERYEAEQRRLSLELEKARLDAVAIEAAAAKTTPEPEVTVESILPGRIRTRAVPTKATEINSGTEEDKPLVLLADSDANAVKTITKHLETGGYAVRTVGTVAEAITVARQESPAAIALDGANLPDGDGWKMLTTIKEDADLKEIPMIVFAPGKDKERALEMGAAGCFAKPIDKSVLISTIKAALVKRKQRARLAAVTGAVSGAAPRRRSSLLTTSTEA